ncbi:hypothetical protein SAMN03159496_05569 [Rhizobium sp. NFR07]|nr:hypothetical protein SAMN03159496_05569 [Rhizobium sp. NFR07]
MSIEETIFLLQSATKSERELDYAIAEAIGWKKQVHEVHNPRTGGAVPDTKWLMPGSEQPGKVPYFSSNLQNAHELAQQLAPGHIGACGWQMGKGRARINLAPVVEAANPSIALCIAALTTRLKIGK